MFYYFIEHFRQNACFRLKLSIRLCLVWRNKDCTQPTQLRHIFFLKGLKRKFISGLLNMYSYFSFVSIFILKMKKIKIMIYEYVSYKNKKIQKKNGAGEPIICYMYLY